MKLSEIKELRQKAMDKCCGETSNYLVRTVMPVLFKVIEELAESLKRNVPAFSDKDSIISGAFFLVEQSEKHGWDWDKDNSPKSN